MFLKRERVSANYDLRTLLLNDCENRRNLQFATAWLQTSRGKPRDVLVLKENHPVPTPGPGEVIVKGQSRGG